MLQELGLEHRAILGVDELLPRREQSELSPIIIVCCSTLPGDPPVEVLPKDLGLFTGGVPGDIEVALEFLDRNPNFRYLTLSGDTRTARCGKVRAIAIGKLLHESATAWELEDPYAVIDGEPFKRTAGAWIGKVLSRYGNPREFGFLPAADEILDSVRMADSVSYALGVLFSEGITDAYETHRVLIDQRRDCDDLGSNLGRKWLGYKCNVLN